MLLAVEQGVDQQGADQQQSRHHGAHEQRRHRHIGDGGVDDQGDGGRDDGTQNGGDGGHGAGEGGGVAFLLHGGDGDAADGGSGGHARAGDGAEQAGGHHRHHGQSALDVADKGIGHVNELVGDAAGHQVARQNKERNGQQGRGVHAGEQLLGQDQHGHTGHVQGHQRADAQRDVDGDAQEGQHQQQNDNNSTDIHPLATSPDRSSSTFFRMTSMEVRIISTMPMGMAA